MPFDLTESNLADLFAAANFVLPEGEMVFFGIRGCTPLEDGGTGFAGSQKLEFLGVNYTHLRCTIGQWRPGSGFAVFPASTVPYITAIQGGMSSGGVGVNQLAYGYYTKDHRYYKGDHKISNPRTRHRAFRNDSILPVWRTTDDEDYEGDDTLDTQIVYDNIHCAWQQNVDQGYFSSNGCQVIAGRPRVLSRGWNEELGPWKTFVANGYGASQARFSYALFSGREAMKVAELGSDQRAQSVRFGSSGPLVEAVQQALLHRGFDLGEAGADGDCGFKTINAIRLFQLQKFGATATDLIVGPQTGAELGIDWPRFGADAPDFRPAQEPTNEGGGAATVNEESGPASAGGPEGVFSERYQVTFRSLVPGGFFSSDPDDLSVKRSIRTNNPGALNITNWQRNFPGYAGKTQPDGAGNVTTIYATPEHGVAAWYHLLTERYGFGQDGTVVLKDLARKYAGVSSDNSPAVRSYVAGWKRWSGDRLNRDSAVTLSSDSQVLLLARAMYGHEAGLASPLDDEQIVAAVKMKRAGTLPEE